MPQGKGTYGSKVGRPPRKKYADGTDEESILSRGYDSLVTAYNPLTPINKPLQKIDEAVDDYPVLDSLISPIAKGVNFLSDTADTILNTPRAAVEYVQSRDDETEDGSRGLFGGIGRKGRQERRAARREARRNKDLPEEQQKGLLVKKGLTKEERQKELDILREEEEVIKAYEAKKDRERRNAERGIEQTQRIRAESRDRGDAMFRENVEALTGSNAGTEGSRGTRRVKRAEGGGMTAEERRKTNESLLMKSIKAQIDREEKNYPQKELDRSRNNLIKNASSMWSKDEIEGYLEAERKRRFEERRETAIEGNPLLEKRQIRNEGGAMDEQMSLLMEEPIEESLLPDNKMEEDYVDYVMQETLSNEDRNYLISALEKDDRLSEIFDQVVESATEFSGSGPIEGPGNEKSDSIPARLSDGEFVFTAKATEEIGEDSLMSMMKDAEASADQRQGVSYGGMIDEEDQAVPIPTTASRAAQGNVPNVVKQSRQVEEEMLKSSPRRYYVPVSG